MGKLQLRAIDKTNWEEAISLSVKEEQKSFIASNLYSIAEERYLENFHLRGLYLEDEMIGFTMFGIDPDDGNYWIYRAMINHSQQGKGYGYQLVKLVVDEIKNNSQKEQVLIMNGYDQDNMGARRTYLKAGFVETEIAPWGEQLAKYEG